MNQLFIISPYKSITLTYICALFYFKILYIQAKLIYTFPVYIGVKIMCLTPVHLYRY